MSWFLLVIVVGVNAIMPQRYSVAATHLFEMEANGKE